jgi:hypothetical protein
VSEPLTVLITNIAFAFRSGTEIVVDQIARGLKRRGHRPIVFAPYIGGGLTDGLRENGIAVVDRLRSVGCIPDIIHGQHNVTTVMALAAFPQTPALFSCHDFDAPKDRAPIVPRIRRYLAVDEGCRERLIRDGAPCERIEVVYNAVDLDQLRLRSPLPERPHRVLALTKGSEHLPIVRAAAGAAGLVLDELGSGSGSVVSDLPERFPNYDVVIATARMAKEAIAAGCAVVACDHRGFAGLVTTQVLEGWRQRNFGRQILTQPVTVERLLDAFARYDAEDATRVALAVRAGDDLGSQSERLEGIYLSMLREAEAVDPMADMQALAPFLEDFLISRDLSRPWAELYRNVVGEASDALEVAVSGYAGTIRADIQRGFDQLSRELTAHFSSSPAVAGHRA